MEGSVSESGNSSGVRGSVDDANACNPESSDPSHVSAIGAEAEESSCSGSGSGSYNASHPSTLNASDECQDEIDKGESILKTSRPSNKQHSTLVDSNFVENYFKVRIRSSSIYKEIFTQNLLRHYGSEKGNTLYTFFMSRLFSNFPK